MNQTIKPVVCSFESRRSDEMHRLIERHGGVAVIARSMREIPIEGNHAATEAIRRILAHPPGAFIFLTGVGTEALFRLADLHNLLSDLELLMQRTPLIARGPKPAAALKKAGFDCRIKADVPNTWREVMQAIKRSGLQLTGQTIAVQEYGVTSVELHSALNTAGATVLSIPVYRWDLPEDREPLRNAIRRTIDRSIDVLMFTSAQQARHVLQVAADDGLEESFLRHAQQAFVASIGPTCSETLRQIGFRIDFEASPPKMGPLARGAISQFLSTRSG